MPHMAPMMWTYLSVISLLATASLMIKMHTSNKSASWKK